MNRIEGTRAILKEEIFYSSKEYLKQAIKDIDKQFGEGYAKANPSLIGDYIKPKLCNSKIKN